MKLNDIYTSTGHKFFAHQEAMTKLRNGQGQPIVSHVMLTDICNHTCAFCSVQARVGDSLDSGDIENYLDILQGFGLKAVILSGGGNPILYKCKRTGRDFNDIVDMIHSRGLEIGLITNGMRLADYAGRQSWRTVSPESLDKLTWVRISMSGFDHAENKVYVPDIDATKTTLGFSYVAHDIWEAPEDPHHGKVSTEADMLSLGVLSLADRKVLRLEERLPELSRQIGTCVSTYKPSYVRILPNCLEVDKIADRCNMLEEVAYGINQTYGEMGYRPVFVQQKPPKAPHACYLGYIHPVLNCDGYVYPCDSCVLNESANHQFANPWRICHWKDIANLYAKPVRSLIADPAKLCPGCVFSGSNEVLRGVVEGGVFPSPSAVPTHVNFV